MVNLKQPFFIALLLLLYTQILMAAPNVSLSVSPTEGTIRDGFEMRVTIENGEQSTPEVQSNQDFELRYVGPQASLSIINGATRSQYSYIYRLKPKRVGELHSPPVTVSVDGEKLEFPGKIITVTNGPSPDQIKRQTQDQLRLKVSISPATGYIGEQRTLTAEVQTKYNLIQPQLSDQVIPGSVLRARGEPEQSNFFRGNENWSSVRINRALWPLTAGTTAVEPFTVSGQILKRGRNNFDPFSMFNSQLFGSLLGGVETEEITVSSDATEFSAKPLPALPQELAGSKLTAVGSSWLGAPKDNLEIAVGKSGQFTITLESLGNIIPTRELEFAAPTALRIYPDPAELTENEYRNLTLLRRVFNYAVVPSAPGDWQIKFSDLVYFDPGNESYEKLPGPTITIHATGTAQPARAADRQPTVATPPTPVSTATATATPAIPLSQMPSTRVLPKQTTIFAGAIVALLLALLATFRLTSSHHKKAQQERKKLGICRTFSELRQAVLESPTQGERVALALSEISRAEFGSAKVPSPELVRRITALLFD